MSEKHTETHGGNEPADGVSTAPALRVANSRARRSLVLAGLLLAGGWDADALRGPGGDGTGLGGSVGLLTLAAAEPELVPTLPPLVPAAPQPMPAVPSATPVPGDGPRIRFATPNHDFGRVMGGQTVHHTFVFTNTGTQVLEVTGVRTTCGCTTAGEWSRRVEPGQTGNIPIQLNVGSYSGTVAKSVTVTCNDPTQPNVPLQMQATVWKPIEVTPQFAVLNVTAEAPTNSTVVRIVNNTEEPLAVFSPESSNPVFGLDLRTLREGKEYELVVRTVPPLPGGNVAGRITLKTSSTNLPVISVSAWANVQQAVVTMPAQLTLSAAPLARTTPLSVSIRNNGTNAMVLTDPTINAKGVDLQLKEIQAGRYFMLLATFPAGFEIAPGEQIQISVKSDHPKFPTITVPVRQMPPPPLPAVSAPRPAGQPAVRVVTPTTVSSNQARVPATLTAPRPVRSHGSPPTPPPLPTRPEIC